MALANADMRPIRFALKSAEHASMTPRVRGIRERYVGNEYWILKKMLYAMTVRSGESPLIVCTSDTGILDVASALRMCPPIWKHVKGSVAMISSLDGLRIPYLRKGIVCFNRGYLLANVASIKHQPDTKANCTVVRVMGFGRAVKMALEDMLVKIEVMYHTAQSTCAC
jgi:hypothetical protein